MTKKIKVLIVEDDPMVADINKSFTEAVDGFTVVGVARDGREALAMCDGRRPDLVILDVYMPHVDGLAVLAQLRHRAVPVDVIMITAANDSTTISKIMRCGVVGYIIKPFKFERYRAVLTAYREFRDKVRQQANLDQNDLDKILTAQLYDGGRNLPKNFHTKTVDLVLDYLARQNEPRSAEEVAQGGGISRVTARRYLELLVSQGRVEMVLEYLPAGRPVHRYRMKR